MKKIVSITLVLLCFFNLFQLNVFANNSQISMDIFYNRLDDMILDYESVGLSTGDNKEDIPLNRLIVKTHDNNKLKNYYDADAVVEGYDGLHILQFLTEEDTSYAYNQLLLDDIEYVEHDYYIRMDDVNTYSGIEKIKNWNSSASKVNEAFDFIAEKNIDCNEVTVAVIDSGIYWGHEFFEYSDRIVDSKYYLEKSVGIDDEGNKIIIKQSSMEDDCFHGTAVSSVIFDNTMSNIIIKPYRVTDSIFYSYTSLFKGFDYAVEHEVDVINISSGGGIPSNSKTLYDKITSAVNSGIVVIVSAGNESESTITKFPACHPNVITVSATDENNSPATFSNYGSSTDIAAPGSNLVLPVPRLIWEGEDETTPSYSAYMNSKGTSYSAPLVSAAAATLKSIDPDITPAEVKRIIKETAYVPENWEESCNGKNYGTGIVNFYNMVKAVLEPEYSATPIIKVNSDNKFEITAPHSTDAQIYYTVDGSTPTIDNHIKYTEPIRIKNIYSEEIIAVCHENGKLIGEPVSYDLITNKTKSVFYKWSTKPFVNNKSEAISWWTNNPEIATVDDEGTITGVSLGSTKITYILESGEKIVYRINVVYAPWQWIIRILFWGFLWY